MANGDNYVKVIGPDKKTYRFPQGTDKNAAIAYFRKKGIGVKAPAAPTATKTTEQPGYFERTSQESARRSQEEWRQVFRPQGTQLDPRARVGHGAAALAYGANEIASDVLGGVLNPKSLGAMATGLVHPILPASYFGGQALKDIPEAYTRALQNPTPENFKRFYETAATLALAGTGATAKTGPIGEAIKPTPEGLRARAAELNTKVLKQAESGAKDYRTSSGLQVANERIIGTLKSLPEKIERARSAKAQAIAQRVAQADAQGMTIDVTPDIQPILNETQRVLNQKGTLDASTVREVNRFLNQMAQQIGPGLQPIPRNLRAMKPSDAMALTSHDGLLSDTAQFTKARPDAVNNLARRIRFAMNERIAQQLPDVMKMRGEESKLITARDAARENYTRVLNDKTSVGRGILYSGAGTIGLYLGLRALGTLPMASIGSVVLISSLARSAPSRTLRAALYARAADMLDATKSPTNAPQGGAGGATGGSAITTPNAPTAPVTGPNAALTAPPAQLGAGGGGTPNVVGSAAAAASDTALFQQARTELGPNASISAIAQRAQELKTSASKNVAQHNISSATANAEDAIEYARRTGTLKEPPAAAKPKGVVDKLGTPEEEARIRKAMSGRGAAKVAMESGKSKAMLDRLDTLYERQAHPKSAMDNAAIQREIKEIKSVLSGEAKPEDLPKINKRIADRERLAGKRSEAAAQQVTSGPTATRGGEAVASQASPEQRAMLLEQGYAKLASYEGGPEMVKAMQKMAKDLQRVDPSYDEVTRLAEALKVMQEVTGQ